jgi:hypothetical protein
MLKRDELSNPESCINKAADDEPVFVLRAQDVLAATTVRLWADMALLHGTPFEKLGEAYGLARLMDDWQAEHTAKVPD